MIVTHNERTEQRVNANQNSKNMKTTWRKLRDKEKFNLEEIEVVNGQ